MDVAVCSETLFAFIKKNISTFSCLLFLLFHSLSQFVWHRWMDTFTHAHIRKTLDVLDTRAKWSKTYNSYFISLCSLNVYLTTKNFYDMRNKIQRHSDDSNSKQRENQMKMWFLFSFFCRKFNQRPRNQTICEWMSVIVTHTTTIFSHRQRFYLFIFVLLQISLSHLLWFTCDIWIFNLLLSCAQGLLNCDPRQANEIHFIFIFVFAFSVCIEMASMHAEADESDESLISKKSRFFTLNRMLFCSAKLVAKCN